MNNAKLPAINKIFIALSILGCAVFALLLAPPILKTLLAFLEPKASGIRGEYFVKEIFVRSALCGILFFVLCVLTLFGITGRLINFIATRRLFICKKAPPCSASPSSALTRTALRRLFIVLLLASPVIYRMIIIFFFSVNVPIWDDFLWILRLLNPIKEGSLTASGFFYGILVSPRVYIVSYGILSLLGVLCDLSIPFMLYVSVIPANLIYFFLAFYLIRKAKNSGASTKIKTFFLCAGFGFSVNNIGYLKSILFTEGAYIMGLLSGFSAAAIYFFYSSFYASNQRRIIFFSLAIFFCILTVFSSPMGLALLPSFLIVILLLVISNRNDKKIKILPHLAVFTAAFIIISTLYFYILHILSIINNIPVAPVDFNLIKCVLYFISITGYGLANPMLAPAAGIVFTGLSIVLLVYLIKNQRVKEHIFALSIFIFGFGCAAELALFHNDAAIGYMFADSYAFIGLLILLGFILIVYGELKFHAAPKFVSLAKKYLLKELCCVVLCFMALSNFVLNSAFEYRNDIRAQAALMLDYKNHDKSEFHIRSHEENGAGIDFIKKYKLSLFKNGRY